MNLGVFLSIGESFGDLKSKGQDMLISDYLLKNYSRHFNKVYVFSYENEEFQLFNNIYILPNKWHVHRYIYAIFLPLFYPRVIMSCAVLRGLQLTGGLPGILSKILLGRKTVFNYGYLYSEFARIEQKPFQSFFYHLLEEPLLKFANKVIVTTNYLKQHLTKIIPEEKIVMIHNGVDTSLFKKKSTRKKFGIVYIGRFERQKNLKILLESVVLLTKKKVSMLFIGSGSQKNELIQQARIKNINLTVLDSVPHNRLSYYLNQSHIFVLPSLIEGQPKALLEAMACEMPVVASHITAHQEIITHNKNGILCGTDAKPLMRILDELLDDQKTQKRLGKEARRTILEKYSMKELNKKEISLLYSLAT